MTFTAPLGLLALLALPAVLVLHLFRRRLAQRRVAGLFLWRAQRLAAAAGRRRTRLLASASLWLELLAALLLALWLAGPSLGGARARHVVVVLDDSASMAAVHDGAAAADRARALLARELGALARGDRVTVLRTGPRPELLLGPGARLAELDPRLPGWRPAQPAHDPLRALDFARELAGSSGEVWFCTDRPLPAAGPGVSVFAVGVPAANAALLSCSRWPLPGGGEQLRATVAGFGGQRGTVVTVRAGDQELARAPLDLGAGPAAFTLPLAAGTGEVALRLADDALAADNEALLLRAAAREVLVCDLLPDDARTALQLDRALQASTGWRAERDPARAQLVFAAAPGHVGPGQLEVVVGAGEGPRDGWPGPFVLDRAHPWLQGVQLDGVVWVAGRRPLPGRVLVAAGDAVLASEEEAGAGRRLWLDLDPAAGNLTRAPDWPILLANLLDAAAAEVPGAERQDVILGQEARYRRSLLAGAGDAEPELVAPDGARARGSGLRTVAWLPAVPGRHSVRGADGRELAAFAVRFLDPAESDLAGAATSTVRAASAADERGDGPGEAEVERRWLAVLLLLAVAADWWLLADRRPASAAAGAG